MEIKTEILNIDDYDYVLPGDRIAQYPVAVRDLSKLLVYRNGSISSDTFRNITEYLPSGSLMVFNNTRVIRARLLFEKNTGSIIEILLLEPSAPSGYEEIFASHGNVEWKCIIGNLKKWKKGELSLTFLTNGREYKLTASREGQSGEAWLVRFRWHPSDISFAEVIGCAGHIPLPPYVNRKDEDTDYIRYQTVFGKMDGSVAAPTAGLHFTENVFADILNKGIRTTEITLHVGAGTFKPVKSKDIRDHVMHREHFSVSRDTLEMLLSYHGRIIAVGTTTIRTLESIFWLGIRSLNSPLSGEIDLFTGQWEPYYTETERPVHEALDSLLKRMKAHGTDVIHASTEVMIIPGYRFRMIRGMVTNFHQPGSTLLLLVSAWVGNDWKKIYNFALANDYRFLSYGDSSILIK
ncbi:MAG TPA: S-adenosylmethionine:tRNA ribosyltransferase-isomerase [Bacteroidales bacterium]|nr:S-adenosylmethionine:tRNA ribosyltransferase-isomerase [Bacteroidales bacterium]HOX75738.1 S-adenosylmethionine:tRNA ribosyltransferase-isomerase [Bacteroidales bacterium]HQM68838.1 S-adenosylmethionine:tRNA ribosyltransferase-isomerase [Bacteroidales bacterium]